MGKAARFACILTPMLLTLASLLCTILIMAGGTNKNNEWISNVYFLRVDTRGVSKNGRSASELGLKDFYTSHLWNYCSGDIKGSGNSETWTVTDCSKAKASYYFNVYEIFNVDSSSTGKSITSDDLPNSVKKVDKTIKTVTSAMVAMFACALVAIVVTFVIGWFGLLSRLGSCVTTIFADIAFFFILAAASMATALYFTLKEGFNKGMSDFGAKAHIDKRTYWILWLGVGFAFLASVFWMFSSCCCSGRSSKIMGHDTRTRSHEKAPYTYERVAAPYAPTSQVNAPGAQAPVGYEPYRHGGAQ